MASDSGLTGATPRKRKHYGFPYRGSKDAIAKDIIAHLPSGRRLIDLFGGGGAVSHCAMESGKWETVIYNDINPLNKELIDKAIAGEYSYERFTPEFITREMFFDLKDTDSYVRYIWSFGNGGDGYLFGKEIEPLKYAAHDYVVFGEWSELLCPWEDCGIYPLEHTVGDIRGRRQEWSSKVRAQAKRFDLEQLQQLERLERLERLQQLEQLERLQQLERLERLERLPKLVTQAGDYRDYQYEDGDVVYCDVPYPNGFKKKDVYETGFDFGAFYIWALRAKFPVYFSSYKLMETVWMKEKLTSFSATNNARVNTEVLYCV